MNCAAPVPSGKSTLNSPGNCGERKRQNETDGGRWKGEGERKEREMFLILQIT